MYALRFALVLGIGLAMLVDGRPDAAALQMRQAFVRTSFSPNESRRTELCGDMLEDGLIADHLAHYPLPSLRAQRSGKLD